MQDTVEVDLTVPLNGRLKLLDEAKEFWEEYHFEVAADTNFLDFYAEPGVTCWPFSFGVCMCVCLCSFVCKFMPSSLFCSIYFISLLSLLFLSRSRSLSLSSSWLTQTPSCVFSYTIFFWLLTSTLVQGTNGPPSGTIPLLSARQDGTSTAIISSYPPGAYVGHDYVFGITPPFSNLTWLLDAGSRQLLVKWMDGLVKDLSSV